MSTSWLAHTSTIYPLYLSLHKRHLAAEGSTFPYANQEWARGTIQAVTSADDDAECTLTLLGSGDGQFDDDEFFDRFGAGPKFFKINILLYDETSLSGLDPRKVVSLGITGMAEGTTGDATHLRGVTAGPIYQLIAKGQILDKDDLVGKTWRAITDNGPAGGKHFLERWPEPCRERTQFLGKITSAGDVFTVTFSPALDPTLTGHASGNVRIWFGTSDVDNSITLTVGGQDDTFTLTHGADTTDPIAWDADATDIQTALNALPSISTGGNSVTVSFLKQSIKVQRIKRILPYEPATGSKLTTTGTSWDEDQWAGDAFDMMYQDCDQITRRTRITGNSTDGELEFDTIAWRPNPFGTSDDGQPGDPWPTVSTLHIIAKADPTTNQGFWHDGADFRASLWYRTGGFAMETSPSIDALDCTASLCNVPTQSIDVTKWGIVEEVWESFVETVNPAQWVDVWNKDIDYGEDGDGRGVGQLDMDKNYTPNWARFFGAVQYDIEGLSLEFVDADYAGGDDPPQTWGEIKDIDPDLPNPFDKAGLDHDLGWRRKFPYRARNPFFIKSMYQPSDDGPFTPQEDQEAGPMDMPPFEERTGRYKTMPKETHFAEYGDDGALPSMFTAAAGDTAYVNDKLTRYVGHNQFDPIVDMNSDDYDGFVIQFCNHLRGPKQTTAPYTPTRSGDIVDVGSQWIVSSADWHPGEPLIEHSGTAAAFDGTSLTFDTPFATSSFTLNPDRGRWKNAQPDTSLCPHWIEIETDSTAHTWEARPITIHEEGDLATVGWVGNVDADSSTPNWRIREPHCPGDRTGEPLNPVQDRYANFTDGVTTHTIKIQYNHKHVLWFESALPGEVTTDWSVTITDNEFGENFRIGGTYWKQDGKWRIPTGTDPRSGTSLDFPDDERKIPPHARADKFGKMIKGDYMGDWIKEDIEAVLAVMVDTKKGYDFVSKGENNFLGGGSGPQHRTYNAVGSPTYQDAWDYMVGAADGFWPVLSSSSDGDPSCQKTVTVSDNTSGGGNIQGQVDDLETIRKRAYPHITGFTTLLLPSAVDFYAKGVIAVDDPDEGVSTDWTHRVEAHFDPQGISLTFREYAVIGSLGAAQTAERWGASVGAADASVPTYTKPPDPLGHSDTMTPDYADIRTVSGYVIADKVAVLHWSF
jgi:hypothetical protein